MTFGANLKREDMAVQMTHAYTWSQISHQVFISLVKYQHTFLKQKCVSKRTGKFQFKSFGEGTGQY